MRLPAIGHKIAALCLLLASCTANAAVLALPTPAPKERPLVDNNNVPALDLPASCITDPRCQTQASLPVEAAPVPSAQQPIAPAPIIDARHFSPSFAAGSAGDAGFQTLSGDPLTPSPALSSFDGAATGRRTDESGFAWQIGQGWMQAVTSVRAMMALPEDWQDNNTLHGDIALSGLGNCGDAGMAHIHPECAVGGFEPVMRSLCVAGDGSYNTIGASAQRDCPAGSIYVSNKRGAGTAEYAAYTQSLNNFVKDAVNFDRLQPVEARAPRQDGPARQSWRGNDGHAGQGGEPEEPGLLRKIMGWLKDPIVLLLLVLGMAGILVGDAVIRARRA